MSADRRLLERETHLARVSDAIAQARRGEGSLIVLEGDAGSGKTSLLDAARSSTGLADFGSFRAAGAELERELPFGVVRQLFEGELHSLPDADRRRAFSGAAMLAAPMLGASAGAAGELSTLAPEVSLLHGIYWLLVNLSEERPLLLTVDDAQSADPSSLRFLEFISRRVADLPVLGLVATREPLSPGLEAERLQLRPLPPAAVTKFVAEAFARPVAAEFATACHEASGGNPFYLRELVRELVAVGIEPTPGAAGRVSRLGPRSVASSVLARIARSPTAVLVARAVAVLGESAQVGLVAELSGLEESLAASGLSELIQDGVLADRAPAEFAHPIVRSALYMDLTATERALLHGRAARLIADAGRPIGEVAAQLLLSEPDGEQWARETLVGAAAEATRSGASETAIRCLRRAIDELPNEAGTRLLSDLGALEFRVGDEAAIAHLELGLELAATADERARAARELAPALVSQGRIDPAVDLLSELARSLDREGSGELALRLRGDLIGLLLLEPGRVIGVDQLAGLQRLPGRTPAERVVLANLAQWKAMCGEPAAAVMPLVERALAGERLLEEASVESTAFNYCTFLLIAAERFDEADELLGRALEQATRRGSFLGFWLASVMRSLSAYRKGDLAGAEMEARAVVDGAAVHGWTTAVPNATGFLIDALIERGELPDAEAVLEAGWPEGEEIPDQLLYHSLLAARGRLRIAGLRLREGVDDLLEIGRRSARNETSNTAGAPTHRTYAVPALLGLGEHGQAAALAGEELAIAEGWGTPRGIGIALHVRALTAEGPERVRLLESACETLRPTPARLDLGRALAALGAELRRDREATASRGPLREARELAAVCGARPLVDYAETELAASGVRRRTRVMLTGVEALTPSERRVATLAAEGLTNAEIAQSLFVTRKTVEMHLGNGYRKLGIHSRSELPQTLVAKA